MSIQLHCQIFSPYSIKRFLYSRQILAALMIGISKTQIRNAGYRNIKITDERRNRRMSGKIYYSGIRENGKSSRSSGALV
jgi:hypothetical protein